MILKDNQELEVVAILPMRHSSERVPGKNYRPLAGRPLFQHVLDMLLTVDCIDRVVVDTDSPTIEEIVTASYSQVTLLERPMNLRSGETPMNDVLLNTVEQVPGDLYIQTHSTNPFLKRETVERAFDVFRDEACDSVFSVTPFHARFWSADLAPINHDPAVLQRTQDLAPLYLENSCLYIFTPGGLRECRNRIGRHPAVVEIDGVEAIDIDNEADFVLASAVAREQCEGSADELGASRVGVAL